MDVPRGEAAWRLMMSPAAARRRDIDAVYFNMSNCRDLQDACIADLEVARAGAEAHHAAVRIIENDTSSEGVSEPQYFHR